MSGEGFIGRWSRRKREARADEKPRPETAPPAAAVPPDKPLAPAPASPDRPPLPPVESLTAESDFAPFMQRDVDPTLKGRALKTLFGDPALYPMDGLDVYIDDYSKPDPLPEGWLEKLNQLAMLDGGADAGPAGVSEESPPGADPAGEALPKAPPPDPQAPQSGADTGPAPPMDRDTI